MDKTDLVSNHSKAQHNMNHVDNSHDINMHEIAPVQHMQGFSTVIYHRIKYVDNFMSHSYHKD